MRVALLPKVLSVMCLVVIGLVNDIRGEGSASTWSMVMWREVGRKAACMRWADMGIPGVKG